MANCHHPQGGSYRCECGSLQSGKYCQNVAEQPCPAGWWGNPVCGPCHENCSRENGFNPNCDKLTGKCSCLVSIDMINLSRKTDQEFEFVILSDRRLSDTILTW